MSEIVVGFDGSSNAEAALRWAAAEARLREARLRVVHAWRIPLYVAPAPWSVAAPGAFLNLDEEVQEKLEREAWRLAEEAAGRAAEEAGGDVGAEVLHGAPAHTLLEAAAGADLLVVGSRGMGGFRGLLLGSVSQQCAQHAPCPLVIVPSPREE